MHTCSERFDPVLIGPKGGPHVEFRHYQGNVYKRNSAREWVKSSKEEYLSTIAETSCKPCLAECPDMTLDLMYYFFIVDSKNAIPSEDHSLIQCL